MIEVWIDQKLCDVDSTTDVEFSYDAQIMSDTRRMRDGQSVKLSLPSSSVNDEVFGYDSYMHSPQRFNKEHHTAEVKSEGVVIFAGELCLEEVVRRDEGLWYIVRVVSGVAQWARWASELAFEHIPLSFNMSLSIAEIKSQWEDPEANVKFLPVRRDSYELEQSSVSTELVRRITSLQDYHPFINVRELMRLVLSDSGYTVQSEFMQSEFFGSLYMSGAFGDSTNSVATKEAMDFYVTRTEDCTVSADYRGRVYLTPYFATNSVGMVVDPESVNSVKECYSKGGCFVELEGAPAFVPMTEVYVGFEYRFRYTTPCNIKDRYSLLAFDSFHLSPGHDYKFDVANKNVDKRGSVASNFSYMVCVFDYNESQVLKLYYRLASGVMVFGRNITQRVTYIVTPEEAIDDVELRVVTSSGVEVDYSEDWALYNGYVDELSETEIDVTLRTTPELVSPESPVRFSQAFMDCGEAGWEMTLLKETSIRPYFATHPGCNAEVRFKDVAGHGVNQMKLVEAVSHMFNLRILTDDVNKVVYVEPYDDMWDWSRVWDWSEKIDRRGEMSICDVATGMKRSRKWAYLGGDGVTSREGMAPDDEYGVWMTYMDTFAAEMGMDTRLNPLFSPSQNDADGLLWVGDRDNLAKLNSFDFTPRVVICDGEIPFEGGMMPHMTFFDAERGSSLCFEDRDGVVGLNRFYKNQIAIEQRGRVVTLDMKLAPYDIDMLFSKSEIAPHLRSVFGLTIGGDYVRCLLSEIVDYSPRKESVKCRFIVVD